MVSGLGGGGAEFDHLYLLDLCTTAAGYKNMASFPDCPALDGLTSDLEHSPRQLASVPRLTIVQFSPWRSDSSQSRKIRWNMSR